MLKRLLGDPNARKLRRYAPIVSDINILEEDYASLSDDGLRSRVGEFRLKFEKAASQSSSELALMDELLPDVFAVVREASKRVLGMRHFDVQLMGGDGFARRADSGNENWRGQDASFYLANIFKCVNGKRCTRSDCE